MWQSSEENKTEEKTSREQLAAKERRRLQNRIAQRNHRTLSIPYPEENRRPKLSDMNR